MNKELIDLIELSMGERNRSEFAMHCGFSKATLTRILSGDRNPSAKMLSKIAATARNGVTYEQLLRAAGLLDSNSISISTQEAKQKWLSSLTKMQQSIIENVLKLNELQQYKVQAYMFGMLEA